MKQNKPAETGNFQHFFDWRIQEEMSAMNLIPTTGWTAKWCDQRRAFFTSLMRIHRQSESPKVTICTVHREGDLIRKELEIELAPAVTARASLVCPAADTDPWPAVLALHDHGGYYYYGREKIIDIPVPQNALDDFKQQYYGGRSWVNHLAHRGYLVLAVDAFYFGSRRLDFSSLPPEIQLPYDLNGFTEDSPDYIQRWNCNAEAYEKQIAKHLSILPITWPGLLVESDIRAVDYLCTLPEVDSSRIACCGLSLGGFRSALLCGLDKRIRCAVVAGWMCTFRSLLHQNLRDHTFMLYTPHLLEYGDLPDITGLHAPYPLLVQQCRQDTLFSVSGMESAEKILQQYYSSASARDNLSIRYYNNGHQFNVTMQEEAFDWLDQQLG